MDDVPKWEILTLDRGIYDLDLLQAGIRYYLRVAGDYTVDPTGHTSLDLYPFSVHFNDATGKSYFITDSATKHLDLTNNGTSTFYEFLGITSADNDLTGALQYSSTNQASLLGALNNFKITCNLAATHSSKYFQVGVLYNSSWKVAPYSAQEVNNHETSKIALKSEIKRLETLELRF